MNSSGRSRQLQKPFFNSIHVINIIDELSISIYFYALIPPLAIEQLSSSGILIQDDYNNLSS